MNDKEKEIFNFVKKIIENKSLSFDSNNFELIHSERCIEIPWVASRLLSNNINNLVDVGFSMASLDYMETLLYLKNNNNINLSAIDIIKPERVSSRYPKEWLKEILNVPIHIEDIRQVSNFNKQKFEAVTIISTIEHVGFDIASGVDNKDSSFERHKNKMDVIMKRSSKVEDEVLNTLAEFLVDDGIVLISVPAGKGGAVLLQDSLGYYTAQWEYEEKSWHRITNHEKFDLIEEFFYSFDNNKWNRELSINGLKNKTSELKEHAEGLAICLLRKSGK